MAQNSEWQKMAMQMQELVKEQKQEISKLSYEKLTLISKIRELAGQMQKMNAELENKSKSDLLLEEEKKSNADLRKELDSKQAELDNLNEELATVTTELTVVRTQTARDRHISGEERKKAEKIRWDAEQLKKTEQARIDDAVVKAYNKAFNSWVRVLNPIATGVHALIGIYIGVFTYMMFLANPYNRYDLLVICRFFLTKAGLATGVMLLLFFFYLHEKRQGVFWFNMVVLVIVVPSISICADYLKAINDINWIGSILTISVIFSAVLVMLWDADGKFRLS